MDLRALAMDSLINEILKKKTISSEHEYIAASYYVERCYEAFDLDKSNPFRQKVAKILDLVHKFNIDCPLK